MEKTQTPLNALDAVNVILGAIGQSPIDNLPSSSSSTTVVLADAVIAENVLHETNRRVQTESWDFNTELSYPIVPDSEGNINVPTNTLKIEPSNDNPEVKGQLVQRGNKLWDRVAHTFTINKTYKYDVVTFLPFENLPESARYYITLKAARIFQDRTIGSDTLHSYTEDDEREARGWLLEQNSNDTQNANLLADDPQFNSAFINR